MKTAFVHLQDEIPRFGSGRRQVEIISVGWKWVRLRRVVKSLVTGKPVVVRSGRVTLAVWDRIKE